MTQFSMTTDSNVVLDEDLDGDLDDAKFDGTQTSMIQTLIGDADLDDADLADADTGGLMAKLKTVIAGALRMGEDEVVDDFSMSGSDIWDSLRHMELIISIEETFGIELTGDEIVEMTSVASIRSVLSARGA